MDHSLPFPRSGLCIRTLTGKCCSCALLLAEAVLSLWLFVCDDQHLDRLYDRHRGATYQKKITFPLIAQLVREALLQPDGSGHQSFCHARADGTLNAALSSTYEKLAPSAARCQ